MDLRAVIVVAQKEIVDTVRDRRSLYSMFLPALLPAVLIAFFLHEMSAQTKAAEEVRIPIVGGASGSVLVNWLQQQSGVEIIAGPADPETAVRKGTEDVVLVIKGEFPRDFEGSRSAPVQLVYDSTRTSAQPKMKRVERLLSQFNAEIGGMRLAARGIAPEVSSPITVEDGDLSNPQEHAVEVLGMMLMFITVAILTGGMHVATDSTAGERERGSLEPLLLNPVPRWQLLGGKWLASVAAALAGFIATITLTGLVLSHLHLEEMGIRFHLSALKILLLFAVMGPLAFALPAIQLYMSCFARSFKEAQTYNTFLILPVAMTGALLMLVSAADRPFLRFIPITAQYAMGSEILAGRIPSLITTGTAAAEAGCIAALFLFLAARLFSDERIIFGR